METLKENEREEIIKNKDIEGKKSRHRKYIFKATGIKEIKGK